MRVLIVEDEELIREGLLSMVDWAAEGFNEVIGCAGAVDALEIMNDSGADLVITDIYMQALSGLEMIEMAQRMDVHALFVILTGHGLLEYAQKAVALGVKRFLTKPIQPNELRGLLREMSREITEQQRVEKALLETKSKLEAYYPVVCRDFWASLMTENTLTDAEIVSRARRFDIVLPDGPLQCAAFAFVGKDITLSQRVSLRQVMEEILQEKLIQWVEQGDMELAVLTEGICDQELRTLTEAVRAHFDLSLFVGIGQSVDRLDDLQYTASEAIKALKSIEGSDTHACFAADLLHGHREKLVYPTQLEEQVLDALRYHDRADAQALSAFLDAVYGMGGRQELQLLRFQVALYRVAEEYNLPDVPPFAVPTVPESRAGAENRLLGLLRTLARQKERLQSCAMSRLVEDAKRIIDRTYSDPDLSVAAIARQLYVSPQYLSRLFHVVCGETCMDYLTAVRLGAAKELLRSTQVKSYEIALKVGYNHPNYFSALFKKHEGMTPKQYRQEHSL